MLIMMIQWWSSLFGGKKSQTPMIPIPGRPCQALPAPASWPPRQSPAAATGRLRPRPSAESCRPSRPRRVPRGPRSSALRSLPRAPTWASREAPEVGMEDEWGWADGDGIRVSLKNATYIYLQTDVVIRMVVGGVYVTEWNAMQFNAMQWYVEFCHVMLCYVTYVCM